MQYTYSSSQCNFINTQSNVQVNNINSVSTTCIAYSIHTHYMFLQTNVPTDRHYHNLLLNMYILLHFDSCTHTEGPGSSLYVHLLPASLYVLFYFRKGMAFQFICLLSILLWMESMHCTPSVSVGERLSSRCVFVLNLCFS